MNYFTIEKHGFLRPYYSVKSICYSWEKPKYLDAFGNISGLPHQMLRSEAKDSLKIYYTNQFAKYFFKGASKSRIEAIKFAVELSYKIKNFNKDCYIQITDGGCQFYHSVYTELFKDYLIVIPEHLEMCVHHLDEIDFYQVYSNE